VADEPEEGDVADEGEQLRHGPERDPARIGGKRAAERVGEHLQWPAGQHEHGQGRHDERERERRAPGEQPQIEPGEDRLGAAELMHGGHPPSIRIPESGGNGECP